MRIFTLYSPQPEARQTWAEKFDSCLERSPGICSKCTVS